MITYKSADILKIIYYKSCCSKCICAIFIS